MNLADIRKKAEESRRSASAVVGLAVDKSVLLQEPDIPEPVTCEESILPQLEMPADEFPEEFFTAVGQVMEADLCEQAPTTPLLDTRDSFSEPLPIAAAVTELATEMPQPKSVTKVNVAKRVADYNPLETILAGREAAVVSVIRN